MTGIAGLTLFLGISLLMAPAPAHAAGVEHICSAADKGFLSSAEIDMGALELWGQEYQQGDVTGDAVVTQAQGAAARMEHTAPQDPSLLTTRAILVSMFTEYAKAVRAKDNGGDSGPSIARAYTLANNAHDVLEIAQPALKARGCDPAPLL
jgi:hypothetical protein